MKPKSTKAIGRLAKVKQSAKKPAQLGNMPDGWSWIILLVLVGLYFYNQPPPGKAHTEIVGENRQAENAFLLRCADQYALVCSSPRADVFRHRPKPRRFTLLGNFPSAASVAKLNGSSALDCCRFSWLSATSVIVDTEPNCESKAAERQLIDYFDPTY